MIKNRYSVLCTTALALCVSCGGDDSNSGSNASSAGLDASLPVTYNNNVNGNLPEDWVTDFTSIMSHLKTVIPAYQNNFHTINLYAWKGDPNDNSDDLYSGINGGAYISGNGTSLDFVIEIPPDEFSYDSGHRYSVIAHEYFHTYQMSISSNFSNNSFKILWLSEGPAAVFESIYMQQRYDTNYFMEGQMSITKSILDNPSSLESYDTSDSNYSTCVFFILILAEEIKTAQPNLTEAEVYKKIFSEFLEQNPNSSDWKTHFQSIFGFSVDSFYNKISSYSDVDTSIVYSDSSNSKAYTSLLPAKTLTIEDIFSE